MKKTLATFCLGATLLCSPVFAQDNGGITTPSGDLLSFSVGWWDVFDDDDALDFRGEYRMDQELFWKFKPWFGGEITSDTSLWAGGGVLVDFDLNEDTYLTPSVGVGLYAQGGSDMDLDSPIQFRTQIEIGKKLEHGQRIGASFGHISNAGLGDSNPGTEILNLYYHVPYGQLFN